MSSVLRRSTEVNNGEIFILRDNKEGKVGIGRLPNNLLNDLDYLQVEYEKIIPDKSESTYHTWYNDIPINMKTIIDNIKNDIFWNKICDGTSKCVILKTNEMDELYYSNPKNNLDNINLYGAKGNYGIHVDNAFFHFPGIQFYRVLIGLTENNNNIITEFTNLNISHKINKGDYIIFDFDQTRHQVKKIKEELTPRIMLKLHYLVCENCKYSDNYLQFVKQCYITYERITRYTMENGSNPETFYQFFLGVCQNFDPESPKQQINFILLCMVILILINYIYKIELNITNSITLTKYLLLYLIIIYLLIVCFYWSRYKLFNIK